MKPVTALIAIIPILAGQAAVVPEEKAPAIRTPVEGSVYIVTRAVGAESRALLAPPAATMFAQQAACAPPQMNGQFPALPGGGAPMGMPMGMGMGMGLMDSLAGGVASRLLNRAPSCKISVARSTARFLAEGGD